MVALQHLENSKPLIVLKLMFENQLQEHEITDDKNQVFLLGLNIKSLSFHFDELLDTLDDFQTRLLDLTS